jgi:hypothetical protein
MLLRLHIRLAEIDSTHNFRNSTHRLLFASLDVTQWSSLLASYTKTNMNGTDVRTVNSTLSYVNDAQYGNLSVSFIFKAASHLMTLADGTTVRPNGVKYSVVIQNWPYASNTSRLALLKGFWAHAGQAQYNTQAQTVDIQGGIGGYRFASWVNVDGANGTIDYDTFLSPDSDGLLNTIIDDIDSVGGEQAQLMTFRFPRGRVVRTLRIMSYVKRIFNKYHAFTDHLGSRNGCC